MVRIASATGVPWATRTSTWRSLARISSGLCLFLDMDPSSFGSEAILQGGPLQRGRIVERIWRREGLKVPQKQPKRGRLWLNDGSCIRLRPERRNHVWAYDFVEDRTRDGRKFRMLCVVDEFTREALAIRVARRLCSSDVIDVLADLFLAHGTPTHIRSDNGPEFAAIAVKDWIHGVGAQT